MRAALILGAVLLVPALPAAAATVVATRTLAAGTVIAPGDVTLSGPLAAASDAALTEAVVGRQARTAIYEGREVLPGNLTTLTLVERNALVTVTYAAGGLSISTEGRALGRGGAGDSIRVLNVASRATITALINPDGTLSVVTRQ